MRLPPQLQSALISNLSKWHLVILPFDLNEGADHVAVAGDEDVGRGGSGPRCGALGVQSP